LIRLLTFATFENPQRPPQLFGIVNGYDKKLISPNRQRIDTLNTYFAPFKFSFYDESHIDAKLETKRIYQAAVQTGNGCGI